MIISRTRLILSEMEKSIRVFSFFNPNKPI
jgi:hypothetical protein